VIVSLLTWQWVPNRCACSECTRPSTRTASTRPFLGSVRVSVAHVLAEAQPNRWPCPLQLHFSGNSTLEGAINWMEEHAEDADIDEVLLVEKTDAVCCNMFYAMQLSTSVQPGRGRLIVETDLSDGAMDLQTVPIRTSTFRLLIVANSRPLTYTRRCCMLPKCVHRC
jgi:hypothetical protein